MILQDQAGCVVGGVSVREAPSVLAGFLHLPPRSVVLPAYLRPVCCSQSECVVGQPLAQGVFWDQKVTSRICFDLWCMVLGSVGCG